jgi:hypothetical protein
MRVSALDVSFASKGGSGMKCRSIAAAIIVALAPSAVPRTAAQAAEPPPEIAVNRGVVQLETARASSISVRIAEDLASIIDDGATRRVLPVVGKGSLQDLTDLKLLRGIDMAILQLDVLDHARQQNLLAGIESWVTYIAKLYNEGSISSRGKTSRASRTSPTRR